MIKISAQLQRRTVDIAHHNAMPLQIHVRQEIVQIQDLHNLFYTHTIHTYFSFPFCPYSAHTIFAAIIP